MPNTSPAPSEPTCRRVPGDAEIVGFQSVVLTSAQRTLMRGLIGGYQLSMLQDLRKGSLTETGIRNYRQSLAEAGELMAQLEDRR